MCLLMRKCCHTLLLPKADAFAEAVGLARLLALVGSIDMVIASKQGEQ